MDTANRVLLYGATEHKAVPEALNHWNTILNLGLNDEIAAGLAARTGNPRFAYDAYRRFIQMFADVVLGVDHHLFEEALDAYKLAHNKTNNQAKSVGSGLNLPYHNSP